jgi:hypothetical protein
MKNRETFIYSTENSQMQNWHCSWEDAVKTDLRESISKVYIGLQWLRKSPVEGLLAFVFCIGEVSG